jgi:hypothetical protein
MADTPVLVIHGVANRDQKAFEAEVSDLQGRVGGSYRLVPAWWADLGGKTAFLEDTLPDMAQSQVRSEVDHSDLTALGASIASGTSAYHVRASNDRESIILQSTRAQIGITEEVRADGELEAAIHDGWNSATYLHLIHDRRALEAIGRAVAAAGNADEHTDEPTNVYVTRSGDDDAIDTRNIIKKVGSAARAVMAEIDKVVGYTVGQVVGDLNQSLRGTWAERIGSFLGDIVAYQRRQIEVQDRLIQIISEHAHGWGTEKQPIPVVAHSLGGVIAFDAATRSHTPLWISSFVTFGSQASFFEVLDPRPSLTPYAPGSPVPLPPSIDRWTSLWEPLDVLAFAAAKVFRLASGKSPIDIRTIHDLKSGLGTHGTYWHCSELVTAIQAIGS